MKLRYIITLTIFTLLSSIVAISSAYAFDLTSILTNVLGIVQCLAGEDETFFLRKVTCIRFTVILASQEFLYFFAILVEPYIWAFITLTVTIFGIRLAMGEGEMTKKAFILLVKIGVVWWLGINLGFQGLDNGLVISTFDIMGELQQFVTTSVILDLITDPHCTFSITTAFNAIFNSLIWERLDCMLDKLFGFGGGTAFFSAAVIGVVSSSLFSGTMGVMVFFLGIATLMTVLLFAFRAVWIYMSSYIFVGFLLAMTPLIAPFLLMGVTQNAFWSWTRNIMAGMAQPVILFAFLGVALPIMDRVMFDTSYDLSIASVLEKDIVNRAHRMKAQKCQWSIPTDEDYYNDVDIPSWLQGPLKNILSPMMSGQTDLCALFDFNSMDFGKEHFKQMMKIGYAFFVAVFVVWMFRGVMDSLSEIASNVFGGGHGLGSNPIEGLIASKMGVAKTRMSSSVGKNGGGGSFVRSLPSSIGAGFK